MRLAGGDAEPKTTPKIRTVNNMDIFHDDIDLVAESLASLSYAIWLALNHPANVCGNEVAGAAWILNSLFSDFAMRLSKESGKCSDGD